MEELIYLLIKLITNAMSGSKTQQAQPVDRAWQQRVWEQQRLIQQAALGGRKPVRPPPPPPRAVPPRPKTVPETNWVAPEGASRHDIGSGRPLELARLTQAGSLRRRFILTEILRPPVSLRPPRM